MTLQADTSSKLLREVSKPNFICKLYEVRFKVSGVTLMHVDY